MIVNDHKRYHRPDSTGQSVVHYRLYYGICAMLILLIALTGCEAMRNQFEQDLTQPDLTGTASEGVKPEATMSDDGRPDDNSAASDTADADVEFVEVTQRGDSWTFSVTVRHPDTGWDDYADGWNVLLPDGTVLRSSESDTFTRLLAHPHENEHPFTRSQSGIVIPDDVTQVTVQAHDLVDGFGGREITVDLTQLSGDNYTVSRDATP